VADLFSVSEIPHLSNEKGEKEQGGEGSFSSFAGGKKEKWSRPGERGIAVNGSFCKPNTWAKEGKRTSGFSILFVLTEEEGT